MASPIGHGLIGLAIGRLGESDTGPRGPLLLGACAVFAIGPDFDFLPGIAVGQPALYHQGVSHSLAFGLGISAATALLFWRGAQWGRATAVLFAAYTSHLMVDLVGTDGRPPIGIPLFWPVSETPYLSPVTLLPGISHAKSSSTPTGQWLLAVASWPNVVAVGFELLLAVPLLAAGELRQRWRGAQA